MIVTKNVNSAFIRTDLESVIRGRGCLRHWWWLGLRRVIVCLRRRGWRRIWEFAIIGVGKKLCLIFLSVIHRFASHYFPLLSFFFFFLFSFFFFSRHRGVPLFHWTCSRSVVKSCPKVRGTRDCCCTWLPKALSRHSPTLGHSPFQEPSEVELYCSFILVS